MHPISLNQVKHAVLTTCLIICSFLFSTLAFSLDISPPVTQKPDPWRPAKIVVFGDSLSDSNGDSFRPPETAHSTYNLLRTLRGETITLPDGTVRRPMELDKIIGRRSTIDNIKANFDLTVKEIRRKGKEMGYIGRLMNNAQAGVVNALGSVITMTLRYLDKTEEEFDRVTLKRLESIAAWLTKKADQSDPESFSHNTYASLRRQVQYVINFVERDMSDIILDFGDDKLIDITSQFPDAIPLIPDPNYYVTGKWTAGEELDQIWVEYLYKMMSDSSHTVRLDNRAMAGSWTLCAADKMESFHILSDLTDGLIPGATLLFQGSMIPPCEGLVVQSYLNERRNWFTKNHGYTPEFEDQLIEDDTLVVFFNSANDFLNEWPDPNDVAQEYARDVWNILSAGAKHVAVGLLPDLSDTPRFYPDRSKPKSQKALEVSSLVERYNTSLRMRLNLLGEEFSSENGYQIITIDGDKLFKELQADNRWDVTNPILDIDIPGMEPVTTTTDTAQQNFVTTELRNNREFDDTWHIKGTRTPAKGKVPFFADTVHPSAEAHYAIAENICLLLQDNFNITCSKNNYSREQAKADKGFRRATVSL